MNQQISAKHFLKKTKENNEMLPELLKSENNYFLHRQIQISSSVKEKCVKNHGNLYKLEILP